MEVFGGQASNFGLSALLKIEPGRRHELTGRMAPSQAREAGKVVIEGVLEPLALDAGRNVHLDSVKPTLCYARARDVFGPYELRHRTGSHYGGGRVQFLVEALEHRASIILHITDRSVID